MLREADTLAQAFPDARVTFVVADGLGHTPGGPGQVSVHDIGDHGNSIAGRAMAGTLLALRAIRKLKPAVVHFHDPELLPLGLLLRLLGYQVVYDVHEDVPRQVLTKHWIPPVIRRPLSWLIEGVEWVAARLFSAVVAATPTIGARFPQGKTAVVCNYPGTDELSLASTVAYADRSPSFAYVGALADARGLTEVLTALDRFKDGELVFELAGSFTPASYESELRSLPGWRKVHYHGQSSRQEVAAILGTVRAGLAIHRPVPNEVFALPMKLFEYMSVGLPFIASDFPPIRAIVEDARCGLVVNPLNPREIADAMRWLLNHPAEAEAMGARGRAAALSKYNWNSEAATLVGLYRKLLARWLPKPLVQLTTVHSRTDTRVVLKQAHSLAAALPNKVIVVVADGEGPGVTEAGVEIRDLGFLGPGHVPRAVVGSMRAFAAIWRIDPEVVHFHDPELIPLGIALRMFGYKVIYDVHEDVPGQMRVSYWVPSFARAPLAILAVLAEWIGSRVFTAITPATTTIARRFPPAKTVAIRNYILPEEMALPGSQPLEERPPAVVYVGGIAEHRGIRQVLAALERPALECVRLELAGPMSPPDYGETLAQLPRWSAARYHGLLGRQGVAALIGSARVGLALHHPVPNKTDALPTKLFEYMSAGLPVIASDFPVLREIVNGASCGLLVDPYKPTEIGNAIQWMFEHPAEAAAMGARGAAAARSRYNWHDEARKLLDLYQRLLAPPKTSRGA